MLNQLEDILNSAFEMLKGVKRKINYKYILNIYL